MNTQNNTTHTIKELTIIIQALEQQIAELNAKLKWYEEQFRLSQQKRFRSSSERTPAEQLSLFNEAEDTANPKAEEETIETITYKRKKKQSGQRTEQLSELPEEVIEYRMSEEDKVCPCCGGKLHEMSTQEQEELDTASTDSELMISIIESIAQARMNHAAIISNGGSNNAPHKVLQSYITESAMGM